MNLENLKSVLFGLVRNCQALLRLLQREREILVEFDAQQLALISREKDTIVLKLQLLEEERARIVREYASHAGLDEPVTLKRVCDVAHDETLKEFRLQLISLAQSISEHNNFNRILTERSTSFSANTLGLLSSLGVNPGVRATSTQVCREI